MQTSSGQHVLMNDLSRIKKAVRRTTIVVNSRDRNYMAYPNPNHFRYTLRRPITNVISVELMNGSIPAFIYTIQPAWASFMVFEGIYDSNQCSGPVGTMVTLRTGFYTESELCDELEYQLNAIVGKQNTYTVTQNPQTRCIVITSSTNTLVPFTFMFYSGSQHDDIDPNTLAILSINTPARLLGFGYNDYTSVGGVITGPLPMDLENFLNRIYLHLESDGKNLATMEMGAGRLDCFHIFYIPVRYNYIFLDRDTDRSIFTSEPAPLARVANLEISLRDEFGRYMDVNHREMSLVFEITHLE